MDDAKDVGLHYHELRKQLIADGFGTNQLVMSTVTKLGQALVEDGFLAEEDVVSDLKPERLVKAFRVLSAKDSAIVAEVLSSATDMKVRTVEKKGIYFVVASPSPEDLTQDDVRKALTSYLQEK